MRMNTMRTVGAIAMSFAIAIPAFAQVGAGVSATINTDINPGGPMIRATAVGTTSAGFRGRMSSTTVEARVQNRIQNGQNRGDNAVTARIDSLNKLLSRIGSMKNLSASEQASLTTEVQTEISSMQSLQARIDADGSTTTLQADLRSIAPDYRVYILIEPQISLLSAVDRIDTLVSSFQTIQTKIQARVSADASLSGNTVIASSMSDMTAKLSDASSQASAAQAEIAGLKADNGVQATMQANVSALKDARTKIQAAHADLVAARKDAGDAVKVIIQSDRSMMSASGTVSASSSAGQ